MPDKEGKAAGSGWTWHRWDHAHETAGYRFEQPLIEKWVRDRPGRTRNQINAYPHPRDLGAFMGTLTIRHMKDAPGREFALLHYCVTGEELLTIGPLEPLLHRINREELMERVRGYETPVEGFLYLVIEVTEALLDDMDQFELELMTIENDMLSANGRAIFKKVVILRDRMIRLRAQLTPMKEIRYAAEEIFGSALADTNVYNLLKTRLERVGMLQKEYEREIDSLLKLDDNIAGYRSNDIMKTLTVFTVLLTPMMAVGAVWGMNFEHMPELEWAWGYPAAIGSILFVTGFTYWWLIRKGLSRDILDMRLETSGRNGNRR